MKKVLRRFFESIILSILITIIISSVFNKINFLNFQIYGKETQSKKDEISKPVVLLVEFLDIKANSYISNSDFYYNILFKKNNYSFYDYFYENSQGKLEIIGTIYQNDESLSRWFMAPREYKFYENNFYGMGKYPNNTQKLVEDIVNIVDEKIDFSNHDGDNDGFVDGLIIIYAGSYISDNENKRIYPHSWVVNNIMKKDNKYINKYVVISEYMNKPGDFTIGPLCHEFGHILGGIDLYDLDSHKNFIYDNHVSNGLGKWSLMSHGVWCKRNIKGDSPVHFDAWHKIYFGWVEALEIEEKENIIKLEPIETENGKVLKITLNAEPYEYLLIENRQKINFDSYLPAEGILIYHIDESMLNNCYAYSPYNETPNIKHYKVSIIQKDNLYELERGKNLGNKNDVFVEGDMFIFNQDYKNFSFYNKSVRIVITILEKQELSYILKIDIYK
ncbi:MAG: M6 family metalloprotease domain-containing protein [Caldisericia bacterium]|nr:M6 family metalloprotease domain-containing protein [Caldisericia bacterium]